jgi:hypothetical protein
MFGSYGCSNSLAPDVFTDLIDISTVKSPPKLLRQLKEVAPPVAIEELRLALDRYQPQVTILSPQPDVVIDGTTVAVQFQVSDYPLFKDEQLGLGPHLHVLLDDQSYVALYSADEPLILENLEPGTHTIRAFASRPWHESFKNAGAYAQVTFHVYTETGNNAPNPKQPLLTYSRPQGSYGAEPIMVDFYLTNAPLHFLAQADPRDEIQDWRIRCTINGESFLVNTWEPIYLEGFRPGTNWVKLEYLDQNGNPLQNAFNTTVRLIDYQPGGEDTLAKLVRGELSADEARGIVGGIYPLEPVEEAPAEEATDEGATEAEVETEVEGAVEEVMTGEMTEEAAGEEVPTEAIVEEGTAEKVPTEATVEEEGTSEAAMPEEAPIGEVVSEEASVEEVAPETEAAEEAVDEPIVETETAEAETLETEAIVEEIPVDIPPTTEVDAEVSSDTEAFESVSSEAEPGVEAEQEVTESEPMAELGEEYGVAEAAAIVPENHAVD